MRLFFSTSNNINNVKQIVFKTPKSYRKLRPQDLHWVANEKAANKTFLRSHPDVTHEYFASNDVCTDLGYKQFYVKAFFGPLCEGPPMHAHGGLTAAVLDELMGTVCWCNKISVMTREFNIKYRRPVKLNTEIHGKAYIDSISEDGQLVSTYGSLFHPDEADKALVETTGTFKRLNDEQISAMRSWLRLSSTS